MEGLDVVNLLIDLIVSYIQWGLRTLQLLPSSYWLLTNQVISDICLILNLRTTSLVCVNAVGIAVLNRTNIETWIYFPLFFKILS